MLAQGNVSFRSSLAEPCLLIRVQLGHNDDGCPWNDGFPLRGPELSPLESRNFARFGKTLNFSA